MFQRFVRLLTIFHFPYRPAFLSGLSIMVLSLAGAVCPSAQAAVPANDDIGGAMVLGETGTALNFSLAEATTAFDDPSCGAPLYQTVWFQYTSPVDQFVGAHLGDTTGSTSVRPRMSVWTGTPGALTAIDCHPDAHAVGFQATAGTTYYLLVASPVEGGVAMVNMNVNPHAYVNPYDPVPPANDLFWYAQPVASLPFETTADVGAGRGLTYSYDPLKCGEPGQFMTGDSIWYSFTATAEQEVDALFTGAFDAPFVSVFSGTSLDDLQFVACSFQGDSKTGATRFTTEPGVTYFIAFGSFYENLYSFPTTLAIRPAPAPASGTISVGPFGRLWRELVCIELSCWVVTYVDVAVHVTCDVPIPSMSVSVVLAQGANSSSGSGTADCSSGGGTAVITTVVDNAFTAGGATVTPSGFDYDANYFVQGSPEPVAILRRRQ